MINKSTNTIPNIFDINILIPLSNITTARSPPLKSASERTSSFSSFAYSEGSHLRVLEHKTFGLAINRDYLSTIFTSEHPCPEYIVYSQYTGGLRQNQQQNQKMARPINRECTFFMLYISYKLMFWDYYPNAIKRD